MSNTTKRIVFIAGNKDGVGKSFAARALAQYYLDNNIPFHGYDIDPVSPSLIQFYPRITTSINLKEQSALDSLLSGLNSHSLLLVDCAARSIHELGRWFDRLRQENSGWKISVTVVLVITPDKGCALNIAGILERFKGDARYIVIKNLAKGKDFSIYDTSPLRQRFLNEFHGKEIILPAIMESTVVNVDAHDISFGDAMYHPELTMADRSRIFAFLDGMTMRFESVNPWLVPGEVA